MKNKKNQKNPSSYSFLHVQERAKERYNLTITHDDYSRLNKLVEEKFTSDSPPLFSDRDTEIYMVPYQDKDLIVVFHKTEMCVTTLLPPGTVIISRRNRGRKV